MLGTLGTLGTRNQPRTGGTYKFNIQGEYIIYGRIYVGSLTDANYCPDVYLIMFVVRSFLTIMFTQRSSCIGRLQVEKCVSLFVQT